MYVYVLKCVKKRVWTIWFDGDEELVSGTATPVVPCFCVAVICFEVAMLPKRTCIGRRNTSLMAGGVERDKDRKNGRSRKNCGQPYCHDENARRRHCPPACSASVPENARILRAPAFRPARKTGGLRKKNWGFACEARKKR